MLKLEAAAARAGTFTLKPLDLEIASGECHALLGPSGAGKSTVLELIVGFRELQSGRILINGKDVARVPVERRNIGFLPQRLALFPHLNVVENILYGIRCRRKPTPADWDGIASLMEAMGLTSLQRRKPTQLSGGERQRVALARALAQSPEVLILDEPFSALNEALRRELWRLLKDLQRRYGVTTLMVTHDLEEAYFFGQRVHILIDGRLQQSGRRSSVFNRPATLEVARFLDIPNLFPGKVIRKDDRVTVLDLKSLGIEIALRSSTAENAALRVGDDAIVGIRPEFVLLDKNGQFDSAERPLIRGDVVEISDTIHGAVLTFKPWGMEALVSVAIGTHEIAGLGETEVAIALPSERCFCIPHTRAEPAGP